jgi:hypothetical protein
MLYLGWKFRYINGVGQLHSRVDLAVVVNVVVVVVQRQAAVGAALANVTLAFHRQVVAAAQATVPVLGVPLDIERVARIGGRLFERAGRRMVEMLAVAHGLQTHIGGPVEKFRNGIPLPRDGVQAEFEGDPPAKILGQFERILIVQVRRRWRGWRGRRLRASANVLVNGPDAAGMCHRLGRGGGGAAAAVAHLTPVNQRLLTALVSRLFVVAVMVVVVAAASSAVRRAVVERRRRGPASEEQIGRRRPSVHFR